jgi:DnaK suppressor protein
MTSTQSRLDQAFLDRQKHRLHALRQQILEARRGHESVQADVNAELSGQAREYEDDAQKLTTLELEDNLSAVDELRLSNIERALKKIDEGSYGLSDRSGNPIPLDRLEASPESIYTLDEQKARDAAQ